ncbi:hypothetical protein NE865_05807 [Phthorimaea operculella]|nr:hypothetical protein NE865_05807 [Phthorimaea operculella]
MVRETRHLWVGNLPDNIREDRIREHFKRYGRVQNVKLLGRTETATAGPNGVAVSGVCATVAFMDIKSASKAHNAEHVELSLNILATTTCQLTASVAADACGHAALAAAAGYPTAWTNPPDVHTRPACIALLWQTEDYFSDETQEVECYRHTEDYLSDETQEVESYRYFKDVSYTEDNFSDETHEVESYSYTEDNFSDETHEVESYSYTEDNFSDETHEVESYSYTEDNFSDDTQEVESYRDKAKGYKAAIPNSTADSRQHMLQGLQLWAVAAHAVGSCSRCNSEGNSRRHLP